MVTTVTGRAGDSTDSEIIQESWQAPEHFATLYDRYASVLYGHCSAEPPRLPRLRYPLTPVTTLNGDGTVAIDDLPLPVVNFLNVIGVPWPYLDEDVVLRFATLTRDFAQAVETTHDDATKAVAGIADAHRGVSTEAMTSGWARSRTSPQRTSDPGRRGRDGHDRSGRRSGDRGQAWQALLLS